MSEEYKLLLDVLKLKETYSKKTFNSVIEILQQGSQNFMLAELLDLAQKLKDPKSLKCNSINRGFIDNQKGSNKNSLGISDPEKYKILEEIRTYVSSIGINDLKNYFIKKYPNEIRRKGSKQELIDQFIAIISEQSNERLNGELNELKNAVYQADQDSKVFLEMADRIVHPNRKNQKETL